MSYKVIYPFRDLQDKTKTLPNGRIYAVGEFYPATKRRVSKIRLNELMGSDNLIGRPLIIKVEQEGELNG